MRITEVTRRNILDAMTTSGFGWAGRLGDAEFLGRMFDLETLPSTDPRHPTMSGDVWQHRVNNSDDWSDDWVFADHRINLLGCSDEMFLRFLAETIHPVVRSDLHETQRLHALYNQHLRADGFAICEVARMSGQPIYEGREVTPEAEMLNRPLEGQGRTPLSAPLIHVLSEALGNWYYSHNKINEAFTRAGAPGEPPVGNCVDKCRHWLIRINNDPAIDPHRITGNLLAEFMSNEANGDKNWESARDAILLGMNKHGLAYDPSGQIVASPTPPQPSHPTSTALPTATHTKDAPPRTLPSKRFDIALSFPDEHRRFVASVAERMATEVPRNRILYDQWHEAELALLDLDTYLQDLFRNQSRLIVIFICADYERKRWCKLEWRAIRALISTAGQGSIMLIRFDSTEIPGIFPTDGYVNAQNRSAKVIADLILQRLSLLPNVDGTITPGGYIGPPNRAKRERRLVIVILAMTASVILTMFLFLSGRRTDLPEDDPRSVIYAPPPPSSSSDLLLPRIQCDVFLWQHGQRSFSPLRDGDTLSSVLDRLLIGLHADSPGYLYVFGIGSSGRVTWLFGRNAPTHFSTITNPIAAGTTLTIPSEPNAYLSPDPTPGIEYIYVVYAKSRWEELERSLLSVSAESSGSRVATNYHNGSRGKGGIALTNATVKRAIDLTWVDLSIRGQPIQATNHHLVIERWFKHD